MGEGKYNMQSYRTCRTTAWVILKSFGNSMLGCNALGNLWTINLKIHLIYDNPNTLIAAHFVQLPSKVAYIQTWSLPLKTIIDVPDIY